MTVLELKALKSDLYEEIAKTSKLLAEINAIIAGEEMKKFKEGFAYKERNHTNLKKK